MEHDEYKEINDKVIKILRELLDTGDWNASLFLRTAYSKLQTFHQQALNLQSQFESKPITTTEEQHKSKLKQGFVPVYVSLYQTDPYNIIKWENTLKGISEYSINRPIYRTEDHIEEMIRAKQASPNEGYVVIYIKQTDIIPAHTGKLIEDRWGHELLTLRDHSLQPENIAEFAHQGRRYSFQNGKLLLKTEDK